MLVQSAWQQPFIEALQHYLYPQEEILALVVFGSAAQPGASLDPWSDVDALIIIKDKALSSYFPSVEWLRPFAPIYAYEQHTSEFTRTTQLCFSDMRRVDFVFMTEPALKKDKPVKFWQPGRVVFSKETAVAQQLLKPAHISPFSLPSPSQFESLVNQFWYRSTVAVYKVIRDDWLIAWHLSLELIQDCCVLGMMLRDRQEQTNHHHAGGAGNEFVTQLPNIPAMNTTTAILDVIAETAVLFDDLARRWSAAYVERKRPLLAWIQAIKQL